jgi:hypothetical protein
MNPPQSPRNLTSPAASAFGLISFIVTARELLLLEVEAARVRHAWALAEGEHRERRPHLESIKYAEKSLKKWRVLTAKIRKRVSRKPKDT